MVRLIHFTLATVLLTSVRAIRFSCLLLCSEVSSVWHGREESCSLSHGFLCSSAWDSTCSHCLCGTPELTLLMIPSLFARKSSRSMWVEDKLPILKLYDITNWSVPFQQGSMKFIPVIGTIKSRLFATSQNYQSLTCFLAYNSGIMEPSTGAFSYLEICIYSHSNTTWIKPWKYEKIRLLSKMRLVTSSFLIEFSGEKVRSGVMKSHFTCENHLKNDGKTHKMRHICKMMADGCHLMNQKLILLWNLSGWWKRNVQNPQVFCIWCIINNNFF